MILDWLSAEGAGAPAPHPRVRLPVDPSLRSSDSGKQQNECDKRGTIVASTFWTALILLAAEEGRGSGFGLLPAMIAIGFLFYFLLIRPQRREQAKRQAMVAAVKKNDRVITMGGIYGVVTNVHREADEVTIKVDEATNTKLRLTLGSISKVLGDESSDDSSSK